MKKSHFISMCAFLLVLVFSSCTPKLTPFTKQLQEENGWSEQDLKRIQFYVSQDVVLRKQRSKSGSKIESGEIKVVSDAEVEEILIKKGTPGVLIEIPKEDRFAVCFEDNNSNRYLMFGPNPKQGNRYALLASKWSKQKGEMNYGNKKYYTNSSSSNASLLVNLKKVRKTKVKSSTAGGRKVN